MKRAAIILCGQMRTFEFCIQTMHEYLFPYYDCDVFCTTQDCNCIKPRIYTTPTTVNQYVFFPIKYDIETKLKELLESRLKGFFVRKGIYKTSAENTGPDLVLRNNLGWADNFKEMQMSLQMAFDYEAQQGIAYDLFIKVRPDICFCSPFKIDNIANKTIYVHDLQPGFLWDAVFAMDPAMARHMHGFYDYYTNKAIKHGIDKCFRWLYNLNAEEQFLNYVTESGAKITNMGEIGYPFTWLIGDIKNAFSWYMRNLNFNQHWRARFKEYADECVKCVFDVRECMPVAIKNNLKCPKNKKRTALMLCGQLRDFEFCAQSLFDYLFPHYDIDVYVSTQDALCTKPRLAAGMARQYIVSPINPDKIKALLENVFGNRLKGVNIRRMYDNYINDQNPDLCFKTIDGANEVFTDIKECLQMCTPLCYDFYIHVRPDVVVGRPLNRLKQNTQFGNDLVIAMDHPTACTYVHGVLQPFYTTAYPIKWMVSDIKDEMQKNKRHLEYCAAWSAKIEEYTKEFQECIFDIKPQR